MVQKVFFIVHRKQTFLQQSRPPHLHNAQKYLFSANVGRVKCTQ